MKKKGLLLAATAIVGVAGAVYYLALKNKNERAEEEDFEEDVVPVDIDGDGVADGFGIDTTGDGVVDTVLMDTTGDGQIDTVLADTTGDGKLDTAFVDVDGDGEGDVAIDIT